MDFDPTADQQALIDAVTMILGRHADPERARAMTDRHDDEVLGALLDAGFLDLATDPDAGPLAAALVTEHAAIQLAAANIGARGQVAPHLLDAPPPRIALAVAGQQGPVRFGADADIILVLDGADVRVVEPASPTRVETGYLYPYADVDLTGGRTLPGSGSVLSTWWRSQIASEIAGLLRPALDLTVSHLAQREQFGKPVGALQAVQHRLAEAYVWVDGAVWSARSAAWTGTEEATATAATYATMAARHVAADVHQLSGAIGFTSEYDLHLWTLRAQALRTELDGIGGHAATVTRTRWAS